VRQVATTTPIAAAGVRKGGDDIHMKGRHEKVNMPCPPTLETLLDRVVPWILGSESSTRVDGLINHTTRCPELE
jgi:hypothetical protein